MKRFKRVICAIFGVGLVLPSHSLQQKPSIPWKHKGATQLWLSSSGRVLVSQSGENAANRQIYVWDVVRHRRVNEIAGKFQETDILSLSANGYYLIAGHHPCRIYNVRSKVPLHTLNIVGKDVEAIAATFVGTHVLLLCSNSAKIADSVETYDLAKGNLLRHIALQKEEHFPSTLIGALSSNGKLAALWSSKPSEGARVYLFSAQNGKALRTLTNDGDFHDAAWDNRNLEFSPDSRYVTGTTYGIEDLGLGRELLAKTARWVWDANSGEKIWFADYVGNFHPPFSPDGRSILYEDTKWDLVDGEETTSHSTLEFQDLATERRAAFQIPRPWGVKDDRYVRDVRVSSTGKVAAALDMEGNIWVQNVA